MIPREILRKIRQIEIRTNQFVTKSAILFAGIFVSALLLCSCATQNRIHPQLPAPVSINKGTDHGDWLLVKVRLGSGEELPFMVDTGCQVTILDKSLEPKLGKPLGTTTIRYGWYGKKKGKLFNAPNLYLGDTPLLTGNQVKTDDIQPIAKGVMGILGMDCLRHYCIQFDFATGKMLFLDPNQLAGEDLGKAYPLTIMFGCVFARMELCGFGNAYCRPDTGCTGAIDAVLTPSLFHKELRNPTLLLTAASKTPVRKPSDAAWFSNGTLCGENYTNLMFVKYGGIWPSENIIGLQFLARNLVTFNFPKRMMYLKQKSAGPLSPGFFPYFKAKNLLVELGQKGQLPGLTNKPKGDLSVPELESFETYPFIATFEFRKKDEVLVYHYSLVQESKDSEWKLQKAWQTDANGKTTREFSIP